MPVKSYFSRQHRVDRGGNDARSRQVSDGRLSHHGLPSRADGGRRARRRSGLEATTKPSHYHRIHRLYAVTGPGIGFAPVVLKGDNPWKPKQSARSNTLAAAGRTRTGGPTS